MAKVSNMAKTPKAKPIIIKGGEKFKDPKWDTKVAQPYQQFFKPKIFDPKKSNTGTDM